MQTDLLLFFAEFPIDPIFFFFLFLPLFSAVTVLGLSDY